MNNILNKRNIHASFHIGLIVKSLYDIGEVLCGILLIFLTPERMSKLITFISKNELYEDPNDFIMNYLVSFSHVFSISMQHFTSFYLLTHGTVKILILILLWRKKIWAYPMSCVIFMAFIVIQMQHFIQTHSIMLLALTLIDVVMIVLTILEYRNIKTDKVNNAV
ncbi:DUF2127 domain-containing protein [Clostridium estertheticum]|uniref:DUF2127 domain-containing protein n=1 Tax=Clostridium estertheticum TaxID=238834 RepID=UPI0013E929FC|nr:DUF2127 domain-containing protein [Clostridium estertheticum]MBZ9688867.1 DUF2127 domain-containing protein [Clostridium estertheticum]